MNTMRSFSKDCASRCSSSFEQSLAVVILEATEEIQHWEAKTDPICSFVQQMTEIKSSFPNESGCILHVLSNSTLLEL